MITPIETEIKGFFFLCLMTRKDSQPLAGCRYSTCRINVSTSVSTALPNGHELSITSHPRMTFKFLMHLYFSTWSCIDRRNGYRQPEIRCVTIYAADGSNVPLSFDEIEIIFLAVL